MDQENLFEQTERQKGYVTIQKATSSLTETEFDSFAALLNSAQKGIIVCGEIEEYGFASAVTSLAEKLNFPI